MPCWYLNLILNMDYDVPRVYCYQSLPRTCWFCTIHQKWNYVPLRKDRHVHRSREDSSPKTLVNIRRHNSDLRLSSKHLLISYSSPSKICLVFRQASIQWPYHVRVSMLVHAGLYIYPPNDLKRQFKSTKNWLLLHEVKKKWHTDHSYSIGTATETVQVHLMIHLLLLLQKRHSR